MFIWLSRCKDNILRFHYLKVFRKSSQYGIFGLIIAKNRVLINKYRTIT